MYEDSCLCLSRDASKVTVYGVRHVFADKRCCSKSHVGTLFEPTLFSRCLNHVKQMAEPVHDRATWQSRWFVAHRRTFSTSL